MGGKKIHSSVFQYHITAPCHLGQPRPRSQSAPLESDVGPGAGLRLEQVKADGGLAHNGAALRIIYRRMEVELEDVGREAHLGDGTCGGRWLGGKVQDVDARVNAQMMMMLMGKGRTRRERLNGENY